MLQNYPCSQLLLYFLYDYLVENPLFDFFFFEILNQILWGILFGSASRVNWDKLTVIEMVRGIWSVSQRDWFICHIFWVCGLEIITLVVLEMGVPAQFTFLWLHWPSRMHIYGSIGPL